MLAGLVARAGAGADDDVKITQTLIDYVANTLTISVST